MTFRKARIQDLRLDRDWLDTVLREQPVSSETDLVRLEAQIIEAKGRRPLVPDGAVDVVVSNCVLNLVRPEDRPDLFAEVFRVLRRGGRAVISDIVSDEDVPAHLQQDPDLWSGCVAGAIYAGEPCRAHLDLVPPRELIPLAEAPPFPCSDVPLVRHPRETKGEDYTVTRAGSACASGNGKSSCC